ncbi:hypothetical protein OF83DRAFT_1080362 [Amylostereum chailletii]|nr:hypothetical protein OF83DRAFT_1080362 [Amylostereum chailletii]
MRSDSRNPTPPKGWPTDIRFLHELCYHPSIPPHVAAFLHGKDGTFYVPRPEPRAVVCTIKQISAPSHPASGQNGLFASRKISARTYILDYIGQVHCEDRPESSYDLSLYRSQDGLNVGIDATFTGNEARFINDYRGIQGKPNAEFRERRTATGELRMCVWSLAEPVKKGDEIVVSYGKAWWKARTSESTL